MREIVEVFADIGGFTERGPDIVTYMLLDPPHVLLDGLRSMRRAVSAMRRQKEHERRQKVERENRQRRGGR